MCWRTKEKEKEKAKAKVKVKVNTEEWKGRQGKEGKLEREYKQRYYIDVYYKRCF